jgi:single-stranded-DNA-specific exonuclease
VAWKLVSALRFALGSEVYGQSVCLLNARPLNDAWIIEIVKLRNLAVIGTLLETIVPGVVKIDNTRLPEFLSGQHIFCWDGPLQKRTLAKLFGKGVEINMLDIAPEIGKEIPSAAGKSLLRLQELSRIARYAEKETGELEVFLNLFTTFVQRRCKFPEEETARDLQLVSVGTIADIMPLQDENRIIVKRGLRSLRDKPRPGLYELLFKLDLAGQRIGTQEISWQIGPAINAAGRMGSPEKAAALLLEEAPGNRERLAQALMDMNGDRKRLGEDIWKIVEPKAYKNLKKFNEKLACAWDDPEEKEEKDKIPRGITGIMANRLTNRFKVPALVVSLKDGKATGSLRSARGYDLRFLLEPNADLFLDWGGHTFAAGFSMQEDNFRTFLDRLQIASGSIELESGEDEGTLQVDAELPLGYLNPERILKTVDLFEPYGEENGPLLFLARGLVVTDLTLLGRDGQHVKLSLDTGTCKWPALYWQASEKVKREFDLGDRVDIVFEVNRNFFKGNETPQLILRDLKKNSRRTGSTP